MSSKSVSRKNKKQAVIIGAGPAGITAGIELLKTNKFSVSVLERDNIIGGLARTTDYKGCKFDIGPHHFITDSDWVDKWWKDLMKKDFHEHKRFTRIYYNNHFFHYPLEPLNVVRGLNVFECTRCVFSYVWRRFLPIKNVKTFEDWVSNRFGFRLFSIFFKTYTEKVWGINCDKISSDWAEHRIKGFSLSKAVWYAFFGRWLKKNAPRTLRDVFYYPSFGSGTLWEKAARQLEAFDDGRISLNEDVVSLEHDGSKITAVCTRGTSHNGVAQKLTRHELDNVFSTMPLKALINALDPVAPDNVIEAANALRYRGLITINLIVDKTNICPDHWLYVHEKSVKMGRVGNMNNFSLKMVNKTNYTALSLEYFSFVGDDFWQKSDEELLAIGKRELESIGLASVEHIVDGMILKVPEAYPLYDENYHEYLATVLDYLAQFKNLYLMGRNGMHRYNNMDIAMLSAKLAVDEALSVKNQRISKQVSA